MLSIMHRSQIPNHHSYLLDSVQPCDDSVPSTAFCCHCMSLTRNTYLDFEFVFFIFWFCVLSFIGTKDMCQSIYKCNGPVDLKLSLAIQLPTIDTFHLLLSAHLFFSSCELVLFFILYPSSYSDFYTPTYKRGHTQKYLNNDLSGLTFTYISEPVFSPYYSE